MICEMSPLTLTAPVVGEIAMLFMVFMELFNAAAVIVIPVCAFSSPKSLA